MRFLAAIGLLCASFGAVAPGGAAECPFEPWTTYKDTALLRTADGSAYLYITDRVEVDADGAPLSYHPDDVGKPCGAIGKGIDCPDNAGYPDEDWWTDVLVPDPADRTRAYVQTDGPARGYFVSQTALRDEDNPNDLDTAKYLDSSTIPYTVVSSAFLAMKGTGKLGDLGFARHLATGRSTPFVVADLGPDLPLGESSIAFSQALGGVAPNARNGDGIVPGRVMYIVFPSSVDRYPLKWPPVRAALAADAQSLLDTLGGDEVFAACAPDDAGEPVPKLQVLPE